MILQAKNITARQFADEIGIQPSGMSHILGGRNNPSLEFVNKVLRRYPEIDANWLLMGRGEMYSSSTPAMPTPVTMTAEEPDLFAEVSPLPFDEEAAAPAPQAAVEPSLPVSDIFEPETAQPTPTANDSTPTLERILFIYTDRTFREYRPSK